MAATVSTQSLDTPETADPLTDIAFWDRYWSNVTLPVELTRQTVTPFIQRILAVFDRWLPVDPARQVLEIGGAPGQYLAYLHRTLHYQPYALDYSPVGCEMTRRNFDLLGLPITIYQKDLLQDDLSALPRFDVVYSLGLIEHFQDRQEVVAKHVALVKPGGILLLGVPNYAGIYQPLMQQLAPQRLAIHNLATMDLRNWRSFEQALALEPLFRGYVGGFEPSVINTLERRTFINRALRQGIRLASNLFTHRWQGLRNYNSRYTSGYLMGVYRTAGAIEGRGEDA